jgi:DNA-binding HxlR family transcriptional regulator
MIVAEPTAPDAGACRESEAREALTLPDSPTAPGNCAQVEDPFARLEGRWILRILACLNTSEQRFADLRSAIPRVSANILTDRLRALECAGLVERRYLPPPQGSHVYALSEIGAGLKPVLDALATWRARQPDVSISDE